MSTCEVGMVLADSGPRVYQWVYPGSMVSILVFGITKGFMFTKTTLMASSSLHDRVFDKVQSPCPSPMSQWGLYRSPAMRQTLCWALGWTQLLTELTVESPISNYQPHR